MNGHAAINRIYRLVWSDRFQTWLAASEITRGRGKRSSTVGAVAAAGLLALGGTASAAGPPAPTQLPTGGQVVAGQASLSQNGAQLNVQQGSERAVIDWATFNVGASAHVNYAQPSNQSVALNRVLDTQASQILGRITANGQVFLINPNGVVFGKTASVDVGGLVASTMGISNEDFMAGRVKLDGKGAHGADGTVINEGTLRAALGGYIALLAPEVRNEGLIVAQLGTVALASGDSVTLQFEGNRTLAGIVVEPGALKALVQNKGAVMAPGGVIILSAKSLNALQGGVVRNSGRLEATGMQMRGGKIVLEASDRVDNSGVVSANAGLDGSPAGRVSLRAPAVLNEGTVTATALAAEPALPAREAGSILVAAEQFTQTAAALLDVSGMADGGQVSIQAKADVALAGAVKATAETGTGGHIAVAAGGSITLQDATLDVSGQQSGGQVRLAAAEPPASLQDTQEPSTPAPRMPDQPVPTTALLGNSFIGAGSRRGQGGSVTLTGDRVGLFDTAHIDASGATGGGSVRVGGDYQGANAEIRNAIATDLAPGTHINADATAHGHGGRVIVWADGNTRFAGSISARGGAQGGDGGFSEVSGKGQLDFRGTVGLQAPAGRTGTLLLDPYNLTISTAADSGMSGFDAAGDNSVLNVTTLQNQLALSNVTVTTGGGGSQAGDITVASALGWFSTYTLALEAYNDIHVNANISAFEGNLTLTAGTGNAGAATGAITVGDNARISLLNGDLLAMAKGDISQTGATPGVLQIGGTTQLYTDNGSVTLASAGNRFVDTVEVQTGISGGLTLVSSQALKLGYVWAGMGGADISAAGSITGSAMFNAVAGTVSLSTTSGSNGDIVLTGTFASNGTLLLAADGVGAVSLPQVQNNLLVGSVSAGGAITLGNAGTVSLDFDASSGDVITGRAGASGQASGTVTLTAGSITLHDPVRTHGGALLLNANSGAINASSGAHITTTAADDSGTASGTVTATAAGGLTLQDITTTGADNNVGVGSNAAAVTLTATSGDLNVGAITATGGNATTGATSNRNGGNAGNILISAPGGNTVLNGDLRAIGGGYVGAATPGLGGYIELATPVVLTADRLVSSGSTSGNISFLAAVDADATPRSLTVLAGTGDVLFEGAVGGTSPLSSLAVSLATRTDIEENVTTQGAAGISVVSTTVRLGDDDVVNGAGAVTLNTLAGNGVVSLNANQTYLDDAVTFTRGSGAISVSGHLYSKNAERNDLHFDGVGGGAVSISGQVGGSSAGATGKLGDILVSTGTDLTLSQHISARSLIAVNNTGRLTAGSDGYSQYHDGAGGMQLQTTGAANNHGGDEHIRVSSNVTLTDAAAPISISAPNGQIDFYDHASLRTAGGDLTLNAGADRLTIGTSGDLVSNGGLISLTGVAIYQGYSNNVINAGSGKVRMDGTGGNVSVFSRIITTNADSGGTPAVQIINAGGGGNAVQLRSVEAQTGTLQVGLVAGASALAADQSLGGAGALELVTRTPRLGTAQPLTLSSSGDDSALTFTVTGTDAAGHALVENIAGANAGLVQTSGSFKTVTSVTTDGASAGTVSLGLASNDAIGGSLAQVVPGWSADKFDLKTLSVAAASAINVTSGNNTIDQLGSFAVGSSLDVRARGRSAGMALTGDVSATEVTIMTGNGALVLGDRDITATTGSVTLFGQGLTQGSGSSITSAGYVLIYAQDYTNSGLRGDVTLSGSITAGNTSDDAVRLYRTGAIQLGNISAGTAGARGGLRLGDDDWVDGAITQAPGTSIKVDRISMHHRSYSSITLTNADNEVARVGHVNRAGAFSLYDKDSEGNGLQMHENLWDGNDMASPIKIETEGALTQTASMRGRGITLSGSSITSSGNVWSEEGGGGDLVLQAHGGNVTLSGHYRVSGSGNDLVIRRANDVQLAGYTYAGSSVLELGVLGTGEALSTEQAVAGAGNLALDGAATSGGSATFGPGHRVAVSSTGDDSGISFTVTGTDLFGRAQSEVISGAASGAAVGSKYFSTITQIAASGAAAATVSVGTAAEAIAGNVTQAGRIESSSTIKGLVGGNVTLTDGSNSFPLLGDFSAGGNLAFYSQGNLTVTGALVAATGDASVQGYHALTVASTGSVSATTTSKGVTLRGSTGTWGYTLSVQGPVNAGSGGITAAATYGAVSTSGSGTLDTTGGLAISSAEGYDTTVNAAATAGLSGITISSGAAFSNNASGTLTSSGAVAIKTRWNNVNSHGLTLGGNVSAGINGIQLTSSGAITQTGGILSTAGTVSGPDQTGGGAPSASLPSARGAVTLNNANEVGYLGPFYSYNTSPSAFSFTDVSGGLVLAGHIESSHGAVSLFTQGGALDLATYNVFAGGQATGGASIVLTGQGIIQSAGTVNATGGSLGDPRVGSSGGTITITGHDGTADGSILLGGTLRTLNNSDAAITIRGTGALALPHVVAPNGSLVLGDGTATIGLITGAITQTTATSIDVKTLQIGTTGVAVGSSAVLANTGNKVVQLGTIAVGDSGAVQYDFDLLDSDSGLVLTQDLASAGGLRVRTSTGGGASGALALGAHDVHADGDVFLSGDGLTQSTASTVNADISGLGSSGGSIRIDAGGGANNLTLAGTLSTDSAAATAIEIVGATNATLNVVSAANGTVVLGETGRELSGTVSQTPTTGRISAHTLAGKAGVLTIEQSDVDQVGPLVTTGALTLKDQGGSGTAGLRFVGHVAVGSTTLIESSDGLLDLDTHTLDATGSGVTLRGLGVAQGTASSVLANIANVDGGSGSIALASALNDFTGQVGLTASGVSVSIRDANQLSLNALSGQLASTTSVTAVAGTQLVLTPEDITTSSGSIELRSLDGNLSTPGALTTSSGNVTLVATQGLASDAGNVQVNRVITTGSGTVTVAADNEVNLSRSIVSASGDVAISGDTVTHSTGSSGSPLTLQTGGAGTLSVSAGGSGGLVMGQHFGYQSDTGSIDISSGGTADLSNVNSNGAVSVNAAGAVQQVGAGTAIVAEALAVVATADGSITLTNAGNNVVAVSLRSRNTAGTGSGSGTIDYNDASGVAVRRIETSGDATLVAHGEVNTDVFGGPGTVSADTLSVKTLVDGGADVNLNNNGNDVGSVTLQARNAADTAAAGVPGSAGTLRYSDANDLVVAQVQTLGNTVLNAGGAVTQSGGIESAGLGLSGSGTFLLNQASASVPVNRFSTFASDATGAVNVASQLAVTIGVVNPSGVSTSGAAFTLSAPSIDASGQAIDTRSGTLGTAGGALTLTSTGSGAAGNITLGTVNTSGRNAAATSGGSGGAAGTVTITAAGELLAVNGSIRARGGAGDGGGSTGNPGTVSLLATAGAVSQASSGNAIAAGLLRVDAAQSSSLLDSANSADQVTARISGAGESFSYRSGTAFTVGGGSGGLSGISTQGGAIDIGGSDVAVTVSEAVSTRGGSFSATGVRSFDSSASTVSTVGDIAYAGGVYANGGALSISTTANGGNVSTGTLDSSGSGAAAAAAAGAITLTADGTLSISTITSQGGGTGHGGNVALGGSSVLIGGSIDSSGGAGGNIGVTGAARISGGDRSLNSGGGDVSFAGTLDSSGVPRGLSITAGSGSIDFVGAVGGITKLGALNIVSAADVTAASTLASVSVTQGSGTGTTTFGGATTIDNNLAFSGHALAVNAALSAGGSVQVGNAGLFSTTAAGDITASGGFTQNGSGSNALAGDISTSNTAIAIATPVVLAGNVSVTSSGGAITIADTVDSDGSARSLAVSSGSGNVRFDGALGGNAALGALSVDSAGQTRFNGAVTAASAETDTPGTLVLDVGTVTTTGTQTWRDALTLASDTTLTGSTVSTQATLAGANNSLTVSGNAVFGDATGDTVTGVSTLRVSGSTQLNTGTVTTTDTQTYTGAVTLGAEATLTAGNAHIGFGSTVDSLASHGHGLSLAAGTGDISFGGAVGGAIDGRLGTLNITSAHDVSAQAISAAALVQAAGTGTSTFAGVIDTDAIGGVNLTGTNLALNAGITTRHGGTVNTSHTGTATFAAAGDINADGAVMLNATGGITTAGDISTQGGTITLASATTLAGDVAIGSNGAEIVIADTLDSAASAAHDLTLAAGSGDITFAGLVGHGLDGRLGTLSVTHAHNVTAHQAVNVGALVQLAGTGTTLLNGAVNTHAAGGVNLAGQNLALNAGITTTNGGAVSVNMAGSVIIAAAGDIQADGSVGIGGASGIVTAGDIGTAGGDVTLGSATVLSGDVAIDTGSSSGAIAFASTVDGDGVLARSLRLKSGGLAGQNFVAAVGGVNALDLLRVESAGVVTQGGAAPIRAAQLAIVSTGDVSLNHASNAVDVLAALLSGNAQLSFVDSTGLQIGVIDSGALQVIGISEGSGTSSVSLTVGGALTQSSTAPVLLGGNLTVDTTAFNAGNVSLTNTALAGTVLDNSLIGGDFTLHSAGEVSQRANANGVAPTQTDAWLQVGGNFDLTGPGQFVQGDSPENLIGGGSSTGGANVIRLIGVITLSIDGSGALVALADTGSGTNSASIPAAGLAAGVTVVSDSGGQSITPVANATAVALAESNRIGGFVKITTQGTYSNAGTAVATGIQQSHALGLAAASFVVQPSVANATSLIAGAGRLDLSDAANQFSGTVAATALGMDAHLRASTALSLGSVSVGDLVVELDAGATQSLVQAGSALLRADTVLLRHLHDATLGNANRVGTVAAQISGDLTLVNNPTLTVGTVGGVAGITSTGGGVQLQTLVGDLVLNQGITVPGTADITLATAARFTNTAGASALAIGTGLPADTGRWQVWSQTPTDDTLGGLAPQYKQYDADFGSSTVLGSGNGLLYTLAPELSVSLTGAVNRVYDGSTLASLTPGNFHIDSGLLSGDTVVFSASGSFDNRHAGSGKTVTAGSLVISSASAAGGSVPVYGYQLASGSTAPSGAIGEITPAALTVSSSNVSRGYDGSLTAAGSAVVQAGSGTSLFGSDALVGGSFAFTNANAGSGNKTVAVSGITVADGNGGGNYTVTQADNTTSTITPAAITVSTSVVSKTYDGTTAASGSAVLTAGTLFNNASNSGAADTLSGGSFAFTDANAGSGNKTVTVSGVSVLDGNGGGNYTVSYTSHTTSTIDPFAVSFTGSRVYNGSSAVAAADLVLGSLVGSETLGLTGIGSMADKHVGTGKTVNVAGLGLIDGTGLASNYTFSGGMQQVDITRANLTVSSGDVSKTYDGTLNAAGSALVQAGSGTALFGSDALVGGSFNFTNANAGAGNKTVTVSGVSVVDGNGGGNYNVSYASNTTSTIDPFALSFTGSRVYNGSTAVAAADLLLGSLVGSETLGLTGSGSMADKHVATGKAVNVAGLGLIDGTGLASNYTFTGGTQLVDITRASLTVSSSDVSRGYNGSLNAAGSAVVQAGSGTSLFGSDALVGGSFAFTNANAGSGNKTVAVSGITVADGNGGGNYTVTQANNTTSTITPAAITVSTSAVSKTYDGTTGAAGSAVVTAGTLFSNASNSGAADTLSGGSFAFTDANAGSGNKTVTVSGVSVIDGNGGGNYTVSYASHTTSTIDPFAVSFTGSRVYNGSSTVAAADLLLGSLVGSETLGLTGIGSMADKHVGTGKAVNVAGLGLIDGTGLAGNYTFSGGTQQVDITRANLTVSSGDVSKTYDGTLTAAGSALVQAGSGTALFGSDALVGGSFNFTNANAGAGNKTVTVSGITVADGNGGGNYTVTQANNTTSTITPAAITVSTGNVSRTYDGTLNAAGTAVVIAGTLFNNTSNSGAADTLSGGTFAFTDANVGSGNKTVTVSGIAVMDGNGGGNYTVTQASNTSSTISRATVTVGTSDVSKTYDGTLAAAGSTALLGGTLFNNVSNSGAADALVGGSFAFTDANAGSGKTVAVSGVTVADGNGGGNYDVVHLSNTSSTVTPRLLGVVASVADKVYDGNTLATVTGYSFSNLVGSETLVGTASGGATFADRHAGSGKTVTLTGVGLLDGSGLAANYSLPSGTLLSSASISQAALNVVGLVALDKVYDGNSTATLNTASAALTGAVGGDSVGLAAISGSFADKNAGTGKAISTGSFTLTGSDALNYTLTQPAGLTANVTPRSLAVTASGQDKVYDGGTTTTVTVADNRLAGDVLGIGYTANFLDKNAGSNKFVAVNGITLSGADAGNYAPNGSTSAFATIDRATLTVLASGINRVYDGTTVAGVTLSDNRLAGDSLVLSYGSASFASAGAGTAKPIMVNGIGLSGADAMNYRANETALTQADISARLLTLSGVQVTSKTYDGNTGATLNLSSALISGLVAGDDVGLGSGTGFYASRNAGVGISVTAQGITLTGANADGYELQLPTGLLGDITPAELGGIGGITAVGKVYDGNVVATLNTGGATFTGLITGDSLSVAGATGRFADKNVGTGKVVTVGDIVLGGADAGNYRYGGTVMTSADITPKALVVSGLHVASKVYDGNLAAMVNTDAAVLTGLVAGDVITLSSSGLFADKNVGNAKAVNLSTGYAGADVGNYSITGQTTARADITPKALTVGGITAAGKIYDGTLAATVSVDAITLAGLVAGDAVTVSSSGSFADKNVGNAKPVSLSTSYAGADVGNYSITDQGSASADITPASITRISGIVAADRVYDGSTGVALDSSLARFEGLITGDLLTVAGAQGQFTDRYAGTGKTVGIGQISLGGADAGNYRLLDSTAATTASVAPASLDVQVQVQGKLFDGTTAVRVQLLDSRVAGDDLVLGFDGAAFSDSLAGLDKLVLVQGVGITGGADAGNYSFTKRDLAGFGAIFSPEASVPQAPALPGQVLEPVTAKPPVPVFDATLPLEVGTGTRIETGGDAVRVELLSAAQTSGAGLVAVTVPSQLRSFVAPIPKAIYDSLSPSLRDRARATLENGDPLPTWLVFNPSTMTLVGKDVPDNGLPVRVALSIGDQRTVIVVTKGAAQ